MSSNEATQGGTRAAVRRILLLGTAANALLAAASVGVISRHAGATIRVAPPLMEADAPAPIAAPVRLALPTVPPVPAPSPPPGGEAEPPRVPAPAREASRAAPPPPRGPNPQNPAQRAPVRSLAAWRTSRARVLVTSAIADQTPTLASCFAGGPPVDGDVGVLSLELEPVQDGMRIVDAPVERRGSASEAEIACAQVALRGTTVRVPGATPGPRVAMPYPLGSPRS